MQLDEEGSDALVSSGSESEVDHGEGNEEGTETIFTMSQPWRLLRVLCAAISEGNTMAGSRLAQFGLSVEKMVRKVVQRLNDFILDGQPVIDVVDDNHGSGDLTFSAEDEGLLTAIKSFIWDPAQKGRLLELVEYLHLLSLQQRVLSVNQRLIDDPVLWDLVTFLRHFIAVFLEQATSNPDSSPPALNKLAISCMEVLNGTFEATIRFDPSAIVQVRRLPR